jgi:hypothetical protein
MSRERDLFFEAGALLIVCNIRNNLVLRQMLCIAYSSHRNTSFPWTCKQMLLKAMSHLLSGNDEAGSMSLKE